ncbi:MAG: nuclear transport factor 2 family protein [Acidimicrobiales bacterium]
MTTTPIDDVLALEVRRCDAIAAGDIDSLRSMLSDDYVHVHSTGKVDDRAGHLAAVATRPRTTTRGELTVRLVGTVAIITGEATNLMPTAEGAHRELRGFCHQVAERNGHGWVFRSFQMTTIRPPDVPADSAADEVAIRSLEEARCAAIAAGDGEALGRLLDASYTHVTGRGRTMNRDQYIEWIGDLARRHERGPLRIQPFGDTAVIHGPLINHLSTDDGGVRVLETFVTQVVHRYGGEWRFVSFHITPVR